MNCYSTRCNSITQNPSPTSLHFKSNQSNSLLTTMKFLLFSLLTMVPATLAATCSDGHVYNEALYWELRQQMCNNEKCQYQKECEVQQDSPNGWIIKLQRKNRGGKAGFPSCWAATE